MFGFFKETFDDKTKKARAVFDVTRELMINLGVSTTVDEENNNKHNVAINNSIIFTATGPYVPYFTKKPFELDLTGPMRDSLVKAWLDDNHDLTVEREYHDDGYTRAGSGPKAIESRHLNEWLMYIISIYPANGLLYKSSTLEGTYIPINDLYHLVCVYPIQLEL